MTLDELWPTWRAPWLIHEDGDLYVVDKPAGMAALPTERGAGDDAVSRLRAYLDARGVADAGDVVGHQPMDRERSGLLPLARRGAPSQALARALTDGLERWTIAGVETVPSKSSAGIRPRVIAERGRRRLVEIASRERRQRLREQLARQGSPVAGDRSNGGPPAWRLMLHTARIRLPHPTGGGLVEIEAPTPPALERWLRGESPSSYGTEGLAEAVQAAAHQRFGLARRPDTTAYRLVHGAGDRVPGIAVDRYGDHLVVTLTGAAVEHREAILEVLAQLGPQGIYLKMPPKQASRLGGRHGADVAPPVPVRGAPAPDTTIILEAGLELAVRLGDGLSTGIFLDQRDNRRRVRRLSPDAQVLNLFGYTGAFTVAAIAGGARQTVTVDAAKPAVARAERAIASIGASPEAHRVVCDDAFRWLRRAAKRGRQFDLVVVDPPSFATTKRSRFRAAHDYRELAARCFRCLAPGGRVLACTNHRGVTAAALRRALLGGAGDAQRQAGPIESLPPPLDFPPDPERGPHLKTMLVGPTTP